jgi:hypothetical protein
MKKFLIQTSNRQLSLSTLAILFLLAALIFGACKKETSLRPSSTDQQQQAKTSIVDYPLGITKILNIGDGDYIAVEKTENSQGFVVVSKGIVYRPTNNTANRIVKQTTVGATTYTIMILNSGCEVWMESDAKTGTIKKYEKSCP